jgi:hypothetical protein
LVGNECGKGTQSNNFEGVNCVYIGNLVGRLNTTGSENVALGNYSLFNNSSGTNNISIGTYALFSNDTSNNNIGIGNSALFSNTTGANNVSVGYQSLYSNTTANNNVGIGNKNLFTNTTGENNVSIGKEGLYLNTTGANNVSVGYQSLYSNTTANNNVAIGDKNLYTNTTGANNVSVGKEGLYLNTTGGNNVSIGYQSGYSSITSNNNITIGNQNMYYNTFSNENVTIGNECLKGFTDYSNSNNNVAIGYKTGYNITDECSNNVFIGDKTAYSYDDNNNTTYLFENIGNNNNGVIENFTSNEVIRLGNRVVLNRTGDILGIAANYDNVNATLTNTGSIKVYKYNKSFSSWEQQGETIYGTFSGEHINNFDLNGSGELLALGRPNFSIIDDNYTNTNTTITFSVQFLPKYIDDIASTIITYDVEVLADTNDGGINKFKLNGTFNPSIELLTGYTYVFDQSASSNSGNLLKLYLDSNKVTEYTTNVTFNGTPGQAGANTTIIVTTNTPNSITNDLYYESETNTNMGNSINVINSDSSYYIDNKEAPHLILKIGNTYIFDQSHVNNTGHRLRLYDTFNKSNEYTTNVTINGTPGQSGANTQIEITGTTINPLYYQSENDDYAGQDINIETTIPQRITNSGIATVYQYRTITLEEFQNGNITDNNYELNTPIILTNDSTWNENKKYWIQYGQILESPTIKAHNHFGSDIKINDVGNILVVGEYGYDNPDIGDNAGRVLVYNYNTSTSNWDLTSSILGNVVNGYLGSIIYLNRSGNKLVVRNGNEYNTIYNRFDNSLRVYEYNSSNTNWIQIGNTIKRDYSGAHSRDSMGSDFSINENGNIIAIGHSSWALYSSWGNIPYGRWIIYKYNSTNNNWVYYGGNYYQFARGFLGAQIKLNDEGDIVVVSSPRFYHAANYTGIIEIYKNSYHSQNDLTYNWQKIKQIDSVHTRDRFGSSLSLNYDGSIILIGAYHRGGSDAYAYGEATIYKYKKNVLSGNNNTMIGNKSGYNIVDSSNNVGVGAFNLYSNKLGNENIAIGNYSLYTNNIGSANVSIGTRTLYNNISGINNVSFGHEALYNNTIGSNNVAIGRESSYTSITGQSNIIIGYKSGYSNQGGSENIALGVLNFYNNDNGSKNIAIGTECLRGELSYTNTNENISIGYRAGYNIDSNTSNNILIGNKSGYSYNETYTHINKQIGDTISTNTDDETGYSVSISGDGYYGVIGIPKLDNDGITNRGSAKLYQILDNSLIQFGGDIFGDSNDNHFGSSVKLNYNGSRLIIGAPNANNAKGYVKVFNTTQTNHLVSYSNPPTLVDNGSSPDTVTEFSFINGSLQRAQTGGGSLTFGGQHADDYWTFMNAFNNNLSSTITISNLWTVFRIGRFIRLVPSDTSSAISASNPIEFEYTPNTPEIITSIKIWGYNASNTIVDGNISKHNYPKNIEIFGYDGSSYTSIGSYDAGTTYVLPNSDTPTETNMHMNISINSSKNAYQKYKFTITEKMNVQYNNYIVDIGEIVFEKGSFPQIGETIRGLNEGDNFGNYLEISKNKLNEGQTLNDTDIKIFVSAYSESHKNQDNVGSVRCFEYRTVSSSEWQSSSTIIATSGQTGGGDNDITASSIRGEEFNSTKNYWIQYARTIYGIGETINEYFGRSISINLDSNILAVGAPNYSSNINHKYVTVQSGEFYIDGIQKPSLTLNTGITYKFFQNDTSNTGNSFTFYTDSSRTISYTSNVSFSGTPGQSTSYTQIIINSNTPTTLYYGDTSSIGNSITNDLNAVIQAYYGGYARVFEYRTVTSAEWNSALIVIATISQTGVGDNNTTASSRRGEEYVSTTQYWIQKGFDIKGSYPSRLGFSVDLNNNGDIFAVGAPDNHYAGSFAYNRGVAYVYNFDGNNWQLKGYVKGNDYRQMGGMVSLNGEGDILAASNIDDKNDSQRSSTGKVQIYTYDSTSRGLIYSSGQSQYMTFNYREITSSINGINQYDSFGKNTELNDLGDKIILGMPDFPSNSQNGAARVYSIYRYAYRGNNNIYIGDQSGYDSIDSIDCIGIGYDSLYSNRNGNDNLSIGKQSLYRNNDGFRNLSIGNYSLYTNTTGNCNITIGYSSSYFNTTGIYNIILGEYSSYSNSTGSYNCTLGSNSLHNNVNGSNNVAIGYESLYNNLGSSNTCLGYRTGYYNQEGSYNVLIGYRAGEDLNNIGGNPDNSELRIQSSTDGSDVITWLSGNSSGNVGIGTTSPTEKLHVNGNIKSNNARFFVHGTTFNTTVSAHTSFPFGLTKYNVGCTIDNSGGTRITVPTSGYYLLNVNLYFNSQNRNDERWYFSDQPNNGTYGIITNYFDYIITLNGEPGSSNNSRNGTNIYYIAANSIISVRCTKSSGSVYQGHSTFSGFLLSS